MNKTRLALVLALVSTGLLLAPGGQASARSNRSAMTPPAVSYSGYDLTIASLRAHDNCSTAPVGQFRRDPNQTIRQELGDDMHSSTLARVTVWNWNYRARRIQLHGTGSSAYFRVVYFHGTHNVTDQVVAGTFRTPYLARGDSYSLGMRVSMRHYVTNGNDKVFDVRALGVRFANSVIRGDRVSTDVVSVPFDVSTPCTP